MAASKSEEDLNPEVEEPELTSLIWEKCKINDLKSAIKEIKDPIHKDYVMNECMELVPAITSILQEDFCTEQVVVCIDKMLTYVANIAKLKEAMLVFLEQLEMCKSDNHFYVLIHPLRTLLSRQISKSAKTNNFHWIFKELQIYIGCQSLPDNFNLEGNEKLTMDVDEKVTSLLKKMEGILQFYTYFYSCVMEEKLLWITSEYSSREFLALHLLAYLECPFSSLHITSSDDNSNEAYSICSSFVYMISHLLANPYKLITLLLNSIKTQQLTRRKKKKKNLENNLSQEYNDSQTALSPSSVGALFCCILSMKMKCYSLPCVYAHDYKFLSFIPCINSLITSKRYFIVNKGILLAESLVSVLPQCSLASESLDVEGHIQFSKNLSHVLIYCDNAEIRQMALKVFQNHLHALDVVGQYHLIYGLMLAIDHSGMRAVIIHEIKENVNAALNCDNRQDLKVFMGKKLCDLLLLAISLPDGEKSDLLECSEQTIAALNFLLFLCIRDKHNTTGFKAILPTISKTFMMPLVDGLRLSKGHYELKLKDLKSSKFKKEDTELCLTIGNHAYPNIPKSQEVNIINNAFNCFDLMHSIWARVDKLVESVREVL